MPSPVKSPAKASSQVISYDARSFIIDGQRQLLISAEIHYSRSPRQLWPTILDNSVKAGINTIASYVFWGIHEPQRDVYDFAGDADLRYWLQLCAERKLFVILRSGPYCCAEWNFGGFPSYLRDEPGITIRTLNEPYLQRVEKYYTHLAAEVQPYLATNGGPIVLVQVENEYANIAPRYGEEGQKYLAWMADLARRLGWDVPIIMCEGGSPSAIETVNGFGITEERVEKFRKHQPNLPLIWTELWPAWYDSWGYQHHCRDARNIAYQVLRFLANGGSGWNYYMWHGGTNFSRTTMYMQTTSYDFDGPIDEFGRLSLKGLYLKQLHDTVTPLKDVLLEGKRATQGDRTTWKLGKQSITVTLDRQNKSARLVDGAGKVLFDTAANYEKESRSFKPRAWAAGPKLTNWISAAELLPAKRSDDAIVSKQPIEQLLLTRDQTDYCWYSANVQCKSTGQQTLDIPFAGDYLYVYVDGKLVAQTPTPLKEVRGLTVNEIYGKPGLGIETTNKQGYRQTFTFNASRGSHRIDILATAIGLVKGDWQISNPMNFERKGIWSTPTLNGKKLTNWEMKPFLAGEKHLYLLDWKPAKVKSVAPLSWHLASFEVDAKTLKKPLDVRVDAQGLGKGMIWVNSRSLGRHWLVIAQGWGADEKWHSPVEDGLYLGPAGEPTQRYYHLPTAWLKPGVNELLILEEQPASLANVKLQLRTH